MITLLPRLPRSAAERLLDEFLSSDPVSWAGFDASNLPEPVRYAATGGSKVAPAELDSLRNGLVETARQSGIDSRRTNSGIAKFDAEAAKFLARLPIFSSGEGLRDDVWTFVTVCLVPDVAHWRFAGSRERYLGGIRNTFQRLWIRSRALDRGDSSDSRWELLDKLSEDALVQITERPSIGNQNFVARELGEAWNRAAEKYGRNKMEPLMRKVTLRLRILNEVRDLASLDQSNLSSLLNSMFDQAANQA